MANKDLDKQRQQEPQADQPGGGRKNNEEVGEPVQLNEDMQKGQPQGKPGMGQKQGGQQGGPHGQHQGAEHQGGGQHQGGQHQGGQHQGPSSR